jgi:hypothetical protein
LCCSTVLAWGVSLPETRGNVWLPLLALRCSHSPVVCVAHDEQYGLLAAADETGVLVIWEIFERSSGLGAAEVLRRVHQQAETLAKKRADERNAMRTKKQLARKKANNASTASMAGGGAGEARSDSENEGEGSDSESDRESASASATHDSSRSGYSSSSSSSAGPRKYNEYSMYASNEFDGCREVLRTKLHTRITSVLVLSQYAMIIVGCDDGTVYACTDFLTCLFAEVENLEVSGAYGAVTGLTFGRFLLAERYTVGAIYVAFASGHVVVVSVGNLQMLAFGPELDAKHVPLSVEPLGHPGMHELCLASAVYTKMEAPNHREIVRASADYDIDVLMAEAEKAAAAAATGISPMRDIKMGITKPFEKLKSAMGTKGPVEVAPALPTVVPSRRKKKLAYSETPRYIVMILGKLMLTYDLHRFTRTGSKTCLPNHAGSALLTKVISQKQMIASKFLYYTPREGGPRASVAGGAGGGGYDSDDAEAEESMLVAAAVNAKGLMVLVSTKQKGLINHSQLVEEGDDDAELLDCGCILDNGNSYMVQGGNMTFTSTISMMHASLKLAAGLPGRASPEANPPKAAFQLLHGREAMIASHRAAAKKRRSSAINFSSAPFDLNKIFSKSREQRAKDELLGGAAGGGGGSDSDSEEHGKGARGGGSAHARGASNKAAKALSGLNETREAFEERGIKINRALLKADDVKESAAQFSNAAKEQKEQLKKKNNRWGLF